MKFYTFQRQRDGDKPAGITVSKNKKLPKCDFGITEYTWGLIVLWFVDQDKFTADERDQAYQQYTRI